jgi:hypothetical protein
VVVVHINGVRKTMSLKYGHQRADSSSPRRYMRMESHDGMIPTWEKGLGKKLSQCHFAHHKSDMD